MAKNSAVPEEEVKKQLRAFLPDRFLFKEEVTGKGPLGANVRLDFWCMPTPKLVGEGWPGKPFGIEAKGYEMEDQHKRTAVRLVYQAAMYRTSLFPTKAGVMRPDMVLLYPQLSVILGIGTRHKNPQQTYDDGLEDALARLAAIFRVGELAIHQDGFEVRFHGGIFYSSKYGFNGSNKLGEDDPHASR